MRVLCVARHPFLSEHLCRFFEKLGVVTIPCVGLAAATELVPSNDIDALICEFDLLAALSPEAWDAHPVRAAMPVGAVSLTRHPGEAHLVDVAGVAAFFYLPTLEPETRASDARGDSAATPGYQSTRRTTVAGDDAGRTPSLTSGGVDPRAYFHAEPLLDALNATGADGVSRRVVLAETPEGELDATVCCDSDGRVVVGLLDLVARWR